MKIKVVTNPTLSYTYLYIFEMKYNKKYLKRLMSLILIFKIKIK